MKNIQTNTKAINYSNRAVTLRFILVASILIIIATIPIAYIRIA